ncbi:MAG: sialate O-acetylesterase [Akkermansiaceae bacterium]|jgi:sialate O-acetylesterase
MKISYLLPLSLITLAHADLKLPPIIGNHMVLQQKQANPIWGWDDPGTEITVTFAGQTQTAKAGKDGRWEVKLEALPASAEPRTMTVKGGSEITVEDILVGEVWLCSGQSNMQWDINGAYGAELARLAADNPQIRLISVPQTGTQELKTDFNGSWQASNADTAGQFSAVGYYFGKTLHEALGVPIGLIDNAWGGSSAEAWVQREVFDADKRFEAYGNAWRQKEEKIAQAIKAQTEVDQGLANEMQNQHRPGNLYAGCLNPVIGYGIQGAIWYQGESNAGRADQYNDLMTLMITSWRKDWQQGDFPFYFVQLADFMDETADPVQDGWAALREAQTRTINEVPNTGQAVIIDIGAANDIHPREKREVGERLARWALAKDYGKQINYRSPEFKAMEVSGGKAILTFDHVGGGLKTADVNGVKGFAICGEDRVWKKANGMIVGKDQIEMTSTEVSAPVAVRYAWSNNPICNILTHEGLPLTPFRTDEF